MNAVSSDPPVVVICCLDLLSLFAEVSWCEEAVMGEKLSVAEGLIGRVPGSKCLSACDI